MRLDRSQLLSLRAKHKWTQRQAAKKAGVSLPTYHHAERGDEIQLLKASAIAHAFKVELLKIAHSITVTGIDAEGNETRVRIVDTADHSENEDEATYGRRSTDFPATRSTEPRRMGRRATDPRLTS